MNHKFKSEFNSVGPEELSLLSGTIDMDEKFIGGKPRHHNGVRHKGGKATAKQSIFVAIQRQGSVFPEPVDTVKKDTISPIIDAVADTSADWMTDKSYVFKQTGNDIDCDRANYFENGI